MSKLKRILNDPTADPSNLDILTLDAIDRVEKFVGKSVTREQARQIRSRVEIKFNTAPPTDEEIRDIAERSVRDKAVTSVFKSLVGTGKQAFGLAKGLKDIFIGGIKLSSESIRNIVTRRALLLGNEEVVKLGPNASPEEKRAAFKIGAKSASPQFEKTLEIMKHAGPIAKQIGSDMLRNFGIDVERGSLRPDLDVFIDKMEEGLLSPALDFMIIGGIAGKVGQIPKVASIVKKSKLRLKKAATNASDAEGVIIAGILEPTEKSALLDLAKVWKKLDIAKQLDNPNFVEKVGLQLSKNLSKLKRVEQRTLEKLITRSKNDLIDLNTLQANIQRRLAEKGFLVGKKTLDPALTKGAAKSIFRIINKKAKGKIKRTSRKIQGELKVTTKKIAGKMTVKELDLHRKNLADKINWAAPTTQDKASIVIWRELREELGRSVAGLDDVSAGVSAKIELLGNKFKAIEKSPAKGAKFSTQGFASREEFLDFTAFFKTTGGNIGTGLVRDAETIRAWQLWNRVFSQNAEFLPTGFGVSGVRTSTAPVFSFVGKRAIKAKVSKGGVAAGAVREALTPLRSRILIEESELPRQSLNRTIK